MKRESAKILVILGNLEGGGAERVFVNIINEFVKAGLQTEILLGRRTGVYFDILNEQVPVYELQADNILQYIRTITKFLRSHHYTHIFTASDYITVATVIAKSRLKLSLKLIATLHYNLPYQLSIIPLAHRTWIKFLNRFFISRASAIVAVSHGVANGFRQIVGEKKSRQLSVIYNPVFDESIYVKAAEQVPEDIFLHGKITLINIGRLEPQKNQELLINSFAKIADQRNDLQLIIIGTGSEEFALRKQIADRKLDKVVFLLGFKQNPFSYLHRSALFILSSAYEGLPTVLIESLALGINVVSTNCPSGPDEILENGKFGWLAENKNPESLEKAIEEALNNKHSGDFLKHRAMQFHKKNIIPQYINLID